MKNEKIIKKKDASVGEIPNFQYKITWKHNYKKLLMELDEKFARTKPNVTGFFGLEPENQEHVIIHCYDPNHINYICDVKKWEYQFCPICKITSRIGNKTHLTIPYESEDLRERSEKTMGISIDEYWKTNIELLKKCLIVDTYKSPDHLESWRETIIDEKNEVTK